MKNFFAELKRRNVYKVAVAYAVVGWLVIQVSSTVLPTFHAPEWVVQTLVVLVAIGFPIALVIAWAFELTPEGIKRTEDVDLAASARQPRKHAWIFVVIVGAAFSVGLFFIGRYTGRNTASAPELPAKSIAVLPFDNLSRDPDNAYFRRRRAGRNPDAAGESRRPQSDLAHLDATFQKHAGQSSANRQAAQGQRKHPHEGSGKGRNDQVREECHY